MHDEPSNRGAGAGGRGAPPADPDRRRLVHEAVGRWKTQLADMTAGNTLLYFRDDGRGHLDLGAPSEVVGTIIGGGGVRLSRSVTGATADDLLMRARAIRSKGLEAVEERGVSVLFVTYGMATWDEPGRSRAPLSPIILLPVRLDPVGAAVPPTDFTMRPDGEVRLNPTLLIRLSAALGRDVDVREVDGLLARVSSTRDLDSVSALIAEECRDIPGFRVMRRSVLSTFSYMKLPMVLDLDRSTEALASHDLVAALAGDPEARLLVRDRSPRVRGVDPDEGRDEFLVLDADATQQQAIDQVVGGDDLLIHGPPGTGKSQTIANMIASLTAQGRSVLFVAEKRAAIEAVFGRLRTAGLGDLLVDVGEFGRRPRHELAERFLATSSETVAPAPDVEQLRRDLDAVRTELRERTAAQHRLREPWGVTVHEARTRRAALEPGAITDLRVSGIRLEELDAETYRGAAEALGRWFAAGGAGDGGGIGRWASARILDEEGLEAARDAVEEALAAFPRARTEAAGLGLRTALPVGTRLADWERLAALVARAADVAETFDLAIYQDDVAGLCSGFERSMTSGLRRFVSRMGGREPTQIREVVAGLRVGGAQMDDAETLRALVAARDLGVDWRRASNAYAMPVAADPVPLQEALAALRGPLAVLEAAVPELVGADADLDEVESNLHALSRDAAALRAVLEVRRAERTLTLAHLDPLMAEIRAQGLDRAAALDRLEWLWLTSIIEQVGIGDRHVGISGGPDPEVAAFRELDHRHIASAGPRVRRIAADALERVMDAHRDEVTYLQRQRALARNSGRHAPLRDLVDAAPHVLTALRPCWAMSPLVVSQMLPATPGLFDVVIFDEASQVPPQEAIPAVLRGRRLVVSGDRRQLPPSAFFASAFPEEDEQEREDTGTEGYESILDAVSGLVPEVTLRWHYRSRDERLIAFSNRHVYEGALTTFPGVGGEPCVRLDLVEDPDGEDEGTSDAEVRRVVELVTVHAMTRPRESLGVIAMSARHAEGLERAIRRAVEAGPEELEWLLSEDRPEPFFVKNLERVQGDERDAIILSIGYGRDPRTGRLHQRFGPLMTDGGERRLNVAVTRARRRITVVSTFAHTDMDPDRLDRPGVRMLHDYLRYAAEGGGIVSGGAGGDSGDLLSDHIADALERAGVPVLRRVGSSVHRIDVVATHPDLPDVHLLAIEHDGPAYHALPTTRARDRLRAEQLTRVGWRHVRVWASEWYADPGAGCARLVRAWEEAVQEHRLRGFTHVASP